jgi:hypothetical protein
MDQQADLSIQFGGESCQRTGGLPTDDLFRRAFLLAEPLQITQLLGFQPAGIAGYRCDGLLLEGEPFSRGRCLESVGKE